MKNHKTLLAITFVLALLFITNCEDSDPVSSEISIYTSWVKDITDTQGVTFTAELKINENNSYDFILLTDAPEHTNSTAQFIIDSDKITITVDADCEVIGVYEYVVSPNKLALIELNDQCAGRLAAIQGVWKKK